ncbi:MAG TPA: histidine phosphatase family protein, partial [Terriglobales bacterium]|nr:histidine phosphatase family protein [Terriglobales bacterium]
PDDGLRPLTVRGTARTRLAVRGLLRLEPGISSVLTSPLLRAMETARLLCAELDGVKPETLDALASGGSRRRVLERLARSKADTIVALVGHEPDLGRLIGTMLFGAPAAVPLKKAGACAIAFVGAPRADEGQLLWLLPPRTLRRLARSKAVR